MVDIRSKFINFFSSKDHKSLNSSRLVPENDDSILFINAGMAPLKDYFLGRAIPPAPNLVTVQKCLRAGGKHNDLDEVGFTRRHHTFFEMCGNFSFGGYGAEHAIKLAWEFLTVELGLNKDRLYVTVHPEDKESLRIWSEIIPIHKITKLAANEWSMGTDGPCGMCTEIFFDNGQHLDGNFEIGSRFVEIWNIVIMTHQVHSGVKTELDKVCIDTGAGLERLEAVVAGVDDNYLAPFFGRIISIMAEESGTTPSPSHKIIADHARAFIFMVADNITPGNTGRNYVLRRIMRRAMIHQIKLESDKLFEIAVRYAAENMGEAYPEIVRALPEAITILHEEQKQFNETCARGISYLDKLVHELDDVVSGEILFKLYDTYGLPIEVTQDLLQMRGMFYDLPGFEMLMNENREQSRSKRQVLNSVHQSEFVGYDNHEAQAEVLEIGNGYVILNRTSFYPESGGQKSDHGEILGDSWKIQVHDVQKIDSAIAHYGEIIGMPKIGDRCITRVNPGRRFRLMQHHSATHLLLYALSKCGKNVMQEGSLVREDMFRLDFSSESPIDLDQVQIMINEWIQENKETKISFMSKAEADGMGAVSGPDSKYGSVVRVVQVGDDIELCCGTHVQRTGDIGLVCITSDSAIKAGVRRLEGLAGMAAVNYMIKNQGVLKNIAKELSVGIHKIEEALAARLKVKQTVIREVEKAPVNLGDVKGIVLFYHDAQQGFVLKNFDENIKQYQVVLSINSCQNNTAIAIKNTLGLESVSILRNWLEPLGGKAGGKGDFAQGGLSKVLTKEDWLSLVGSICLSNP